MIGYNEYVISSSGALSYRIAVPCFFGDGGDFHNAARMNRFYSAALSEMYRYVTAQPRENIRRRSYNCTFCAVEADGVVNVTLMISERLVPLDGGRSRMARKELTHVWRGGVICKKSTK